jgi:hypothetical protein
LSLLFAGRVAAHRQVVIENWDADKIEDKEVP